MLEPQGTARLDSVVRALATAAKALRLYPPSSPIPKQSVQAAEETLADYFRDGQAIISLTVAREGFTLYGEPIGAMITGARELADELRNNAVAELDITPGCTADELLGFLAIAIKSPEEVHAGGGLSSMLVAAGIETIRVVDVHLTVVEQVGPAQDQDVDEFLRSLARDPEKLASWFAAASSGDPATFEEGLMELVRVCGPSGFDGLLQSLSGAFSSQGAEGKDALLGLAMEQGPTRDLTGGMFRFLSSGDIAGSILGGTFGKNMLSLSSALTHLPLEQVTAQVRAEVQAKLPETGHSSKEAEFLDHMIDVRQMTVPEPALIDADATYRSVIEAARLSDESIATARDAVAASQGALTTASVRTMLQLLDQQKDFELYCAGADNLASMVPRLIEQGDLVLASTVLTELSNREAFNVGPWPELSGRLRDALCVAAGPRSMGALIRAVVEDRSLIPTARTIVRHAGDAGPPALVAEAITLKADGLEIAEELLGRRVIDSLNQLASSAQWYQLGPIAGRLARESDSRSMATLESLMRRPDEQSRREVATGLAAAGGAVAQKLLGRALRDPSTDVQIVAARAIARSGQPGAAELLAARLAELDVDNADFAVGRELIAALTRIPGPAADEALGKLASRRSLMKRGHFAEVQDLVKQAQALRTQAGDRR